MTEKGTASSASSPALAVAAVALASSFEPTGADGVREIVQAAAAAGFDGLSISVDQHDWAVADGVTTESLLEFHRENGLSIPAAEVILVWSAPDDPAVEDAHIHILDVAARMGAQTVITATLAPYLPPLVKAAASIRRLCDLAADRGLLISFEFLPWTGVPDIVTATRLMDAVDRENLGLVIDAWHWHRQPGRGHEATLRSVPADRIHVLHLDDATSQRSHDLMKESATARLLPGDGAADVVGLIDLLNGMGASPIIASEVFSNALRELGPYESARRQYQAACTALQKGGRDAA